MRSSIQHLLGEECVDFGARLPPSVVLSRMIMGTVQLRLALHQGCDVLLFAFDIKLGRCHGVAAADGPSLGLVAGVVVGLDAVDDFDVLPVRGSVAPSSATGSPRVLGE